MNESRLFFWATLAYCVSLLGCVGMLSLAGLHDVVLAPVLVAYRVLVIVPLATALCLVALLLFDLFTPGDWLYHLTSDEGNLGTKIGLGIVLAALVLGIFWVSVQG
jgi:hypothetical protein